MASEWFYQAMGKQVGPVSGVELRNLAQAGTVTTETPVANAPNGPWVPAGRVKGLFALPNGSPPPAAAAGTAPPPPHAPVSDEPSGLGTATKITLVVGGGVCILVLGFLVWFIAGRDTWELNSASRVSAKLDEADRLQQSNPIAAYKAYDELLKEAKQHKITDELFAQKLADAEKSRTALYPKVQEKLKAEEAEERRLAEEEARRAAAEKQRIAQEEERNRAAEESQRIAEEKKRAEEKRREEAVSVYRNAPQSARNALNVVKKVEARTEIGINYRDYSSMVGEAWGDVKIFVESPDGKIIPEFCVLLTKAVKDYKLALDIWQNKIQWPTLYGDRTDVEVLMQACWMRAGKYIKLAESLLDAEQTKKALETIASLTDKEEDFDAEWKKIEDKVLHR